MNNPKFVTSRKKALGTFIIIIGLLLIFISFSLIVRPSRTGSADLMRVGNKMGDFSLLDIQGNTISLLDYAGRTILINTWATWCPPCRAEMPSLNEYYLRHQNDGFIILAVNAGESQAKAYNFASDYGISFPILLDQNFEWLDKLKINSYPTSILIGSDGLIKYIHVGMLTKDMLDNMITPLWLEK